MSLRPLLLCVLLAGCGPSTSTGDPDTGDATSADTSSTGGPVTTSGDDTDAPTSSAADGTTSTDPTTAGDTTAGAEPNPCDCPFDQICVSREPADYEPIPRCEDRPPGCDVSDPCSPECAATCGDWPCGEPLYSPPEPGIVYCLKPLQCECAADELCVLATGIDSFYTICVVPPADCDPADVCSTACASACQLAPPLPEGCDGGEPPPWLDCGESPASECSLWAQNCPDGEKCSYSNDWGELRCIPVPADPAGLGEPCMYVENVDNCEKGGVCFGLDPDGVTPVCIPQCGGSADAPECPGDTLCLDENDSELLACLPACDPLASTCGPGTACLETGGQFVCVLEVSEDGGAPLDDCPYLNACDDGLVCIKSANLPGCGAQCCTPYCDLGAPVCDLPGTTCVSLFDYLEEPAPPEFADVGFCGSAP